MRGLNTTVPIRYQGGFDEIPGDEIEKETQSDAVQPCKLYFGELEIGGWVVMAAGGGEDETEKKKMGKVRKTSADKEKNCKGVGSVTTTTDSTMSSDVRSAQSLCRRGGPGEGGAQ